MKKGLLDKIGEGEGELKASQEAINEYKTCITELEETTIPLLISAAELGNTEPLINYLGLKLDDKRLTDYLSYTLKNAKLGRYLPKLKTKKIRRKEHLAWYCLVRFFLDRDSCSKERAYSLTIEHLYTSNDTPDKPPVEYETLKSTYNRTSNIINKAFDGEPNITLVKGWCKNLDFINAPEGID